MIGTVKIKVNAANPQLPLMPSYTFVGSPSSVRVIDVPRAIGNWDITAVYVTFSYPDNSIVSAACVRTGGVWVGTVRGCNTAGSVTATGVTISADGTDENGDAVTGYVLGRGDLYVLAADATIVSDGVRYNLHYCEDEPETPQIGDVHNFDGTFMYYNGTQWVGFGTGVTSINGKNGAVTLTGSDIEVSGEDETSVAEAIAKKADKSDIPTVPTKVSAFSNDSGYITIAGARYDIIALGSSTSLANNAYNTDIASAITTAKTYTLPAPVVDAANNRQVRDLVLYADVGTNGSVTFANTDASGNSLTFVSDDFSALAAEDGLNAWLLSEIAANTFLVKRLALTTGTL